MVAHDSEAWRAECEARYVCNLKDTSARREYIAGVEKKRGLSGADKLREDVKKLWGQRERTDQR